MRIGILEPKGFSQEALIRLGMFGDVQSYDGNDLAAFLEPVEALFVRLAYHIDDTFLDLSPRLRWLCSPTTGHNHINEGALLERGIQLLSLRGEREFLETVRATPEHTFGLCIALLRRYRSAIDSVSCGEWDRNTCIGEELFGSQVGIIGLGRVGYRLATYFTAFGAHVNWYDPADVPFLSEWNRAQDVLDLIKKSRIIVLCANYHPGQKPIIGIDEINSMKGCFFVNTARGELVDEGSLLAALSLDLFAGVAIDVITNETSENRLSAWRGLLAGRNLILTPHIAGATSTSMRRTENFVVEKLARAVVGLDN